MDLDRAIKLRRSVKKFKTTKKVDWRNIIECLESLKYAPIAGGNFTLKAILINDEQKIKKIAEFCAQDFIATAEYVVVICSNPSRLVNAFEERGEIYSRQQSGAAIQNFLLKITEAGLSTCWVGHFEEEQIKKLLKVPNNVNIEALFPIGYEFEKPRTRKNKEDLDNLLRFNDYLGKRINPPKELNV